MTMSNHRCLYFYPMAERVGFEPTIPRGIPHFECGAFGHSATSPEPPTILHLRSFLVDLPFSLTSARVLDSMKPVDDDAIGATA